MAKADEVVVVGGKEDRQTSAACGSETSRTRHDITIITLRSGLFNRTHIAKQKKAYKFTISSYPSITDREEKAT